MRRCESQCRFATLQTYPDGVNSDFHFAAEQGAQHAWRYPDLTIHVRYFSDLLCDTVDREMAREAAALPASDQLTFVRLFQNFLDPTLRATWGSLGFFAISESISK